MSIYFYDQQINRYLLQFIRTLSNFNVKTGKQADGSEAFTRVPAKYGRSSRHVESIIKKNSENIINNVPQISCYITELELAPERRQDPNFVSKIHLRERAIDSSTGDYTSDQGNAVTIERLMPTPFNMTVTADIWTSNEDQKHQLIEQVMWLFNPALELQTTDNYVDWTSITYIELTNVSYSSRSVPLGTEDDIDITSLTFMIPIWLTAPAKIKKLGVITKIIASIFDGAGGDLSDAVLTETNLNSRQYVTPVDYNLLLLDGIMHLVRSTQPFDPDNNEVNIPNEGDWEEVSWEELLPQYGTFREGVSQIRLLQASGSEVSGTIAYWPGNQNHLMYNVDIDTITATTINPVDSIIDPLASAPGSGLASAVTGQRYLILQDIGDADNAVPSAAWGDLVAKANDVIEYSGSGWYVDLEAITNNAATNVMNLTTDVQYKWEDGNWVKTYEGWYTAGHWTLVI